MPFTDLFNKIRSVTGTKLLDAKDVEEAADKQFVRQDERDSVATVGSMVSAAAAPAFPGGRYLWRKKNGGLLGLLTDAKTLLPAVMADRATNSTRLGDPDDPVLLASSATGEARLADMILRRGGTFAGLLARYGGTLLAKSAAGTSIAGRLFATDFVVEYDGSISNAAPLPRYVGPGVAAAKYPAGAAANLTGPAGYVFPTFTRNRRAVAGKDLADLSNSASVVRAGQWPNYRKLQLDYGKPSAAPGTVAEGEGAILRIQRNDYGNQLRPVAYVYPANLATDGVLDSFIEPLDDWRALLVVCHLVHGTRHAIAKIIPNPMDAPSVWEDTPWCYMGLGFPSRPVRLDNGEWVTTIANDAIIGQSAPYAAGVGTTFGYFRFFADNTLSYNAIGMLPTVEPGVTYNSYSEARVIQTGATALFSIFRTKLGTYRTTSADNGYSWTTAEPFGVERDSSGAMIPFLVPTNVDFVRAPDGKLFLVNNDDRANPGKRYKGSLWIWDYGASPLDAPKWKLPLTERLLVTYPCINFPLNRDGAYLGDAEVLLDRGRGNVPTDNGDPSGFSNDIIRVRTNVRSIELRQNYRSTLTTRG